MSLLLQLLTVHTPKPYECAAAPCMANYSSPSSVSVHSWLPSLLTTATELPLTAATPPSVAGAVRCSLSVWLPSAAATLSRYKSADLQWTAWREVTHHNARRCRACHRACSRATMAGLCVMDKMHHCPLPPAQIAHTLAQAQTHAHAQQSSAWPTVAPVNSWATLAQPDLPWCVCHHADCVARGQQQLAAALGCLFQIR